MVEALFVNLLLLREREAVAEPLPMSSRLLESLTRLKVAKVWAFYSPAIRVVHGNPGFPLNYVELVLLVNREVSYVLRSSSFQVLVCLSPPLPIVHE